MPSPDERHARLDPFVGRFVGEETMHPTPWMPAGGVRQAKVETRRCAGGFAVAQHYEQLDGDRVTFAGHGVFSIDRDSGEVRLHWWDSMGMGPEEFRGGWEGDQLVVRSRNPMGFTRGIWTVEADGYRHAMQMSKDGEDWGALMTGVYRRV